MLWNNTMLPIVISFGICIIFCPMLIPLLKRWKLRQYVREDGPVSHLRKTGTPTMGGIAILLAVMLTGGMYFRGQPEVTAVLFAMAGFGLIGLLDDYIKVILRRSMGLDVLQKLLLQILVTLIFIYYFIEKLHYEPRILLPFTGSLSGGSFLVLPKWGFALLILFVMVGTVNGTNFTDGLDGLACGVTLLLAVFFSVIAIGSNSSVACVSLPVVGALMGFLVFNVYPARVFMGDTGSLALGGFVAASALILNIPLYLPVFGIIYVAEALSVILQVGYYKLTGGRRLFKMAPIHHHFEQCGWSEPRIVVVFCMITALMCLISLSGL